MIGNLELLKQECVQAAILHYGLNPLTRTYPVVRELQLEREERQEYTYKFAVLVAGRTALVYRDWQGAYKVADDPERALTEEEKEEKEAYQVFMVAVHYLDMDVAHVGRIEVEYMRPLPDVLYTARWRVSLNMQECLIVRYDEPDGARYSVLESSDERTTGSDS